VGIGLSAGRPTSAELQGLRPARVRVDLTRLRGNYVELRAKAGLPLMPVVKADAYGHGATKVALCLEDLGVQALAVAHVDQGVQLRLAGVRAPIVVLAADPQQLGLLARHDLEVVISTPEMLRTVLDGEHPRLSVQVKLDSGMTRLGFDDESFVSAAESLASCELVELTGAMTHLASADADAEVTRDQLDRFDHALDRLARHDIRPRWVHAANSAGIAHLRPSHTLARPGLLLYGLATRPLAPDVAVRPVMTVSGRVIAVRDVPAGTRVSYGGRFEASGGARIATVMLGYADGVPGSLAGVTGAGFSVRGRVVPIAGSVCMDMTMLDVSERPDVRVGDDAVLFGDAPTAWDVADWAGTHAWQMLTGIGSTLPRIYVEDDQVVDLDHRQP
jgi:alanine racemase